MVIEHEGELDEDTVMEDVMELGGDDMTYSEDSIEIVCDPAVVGELREGLTAKGYLVASAEAEEVPSTYVTLTDEDALKKMGLLLEHLEDDDDVQNVWHNWDMPEEG